jgi:hypothetical protein
MVARTFKTLEEAEEFIHVNALVAPLPDMTLTEI